MGRASMDQGPRVNKVREEFQMIVVYQWQFKFKIVKIHSILMEVDSYLGVEKTVRLVVIKTMLCTLHLVLLLRNSLTLIQLVSIWTKLTQLKQVTNQLQVPEIHKEEIKMLGKVKGVKIVALILVLQENQVALHHQLLEQQLSQQQELMILFSKKETTW